VRKFVMARLADYARSTGLNTLPGVSAQATEGNTQGPISEGPISEGPISAPFAHD